MCGQILKYTPEDHPDYGNVVEALMRAEELCNQVNEGVRQKENSDRLEWIQRHVHCDGIAEVSEKKLCIFLDFLMLLFQILDTPNSLANI